MKVFLNYCGNLLKAIVSKKASIGDLKIISGKDVSKLQSKFVLLSHYAMYWLYSVFIVQQVIGNVRREHT